MAPDGDVSRSITISDDTLVRLNRAALVQHTVRTAVHELNNVLQMIAGSAELIGSAPALPPTAAARVETILKHSTRGHTLLQAVSELAKVGPPAVRAVDVAALADHALQLRRYEHKRAAITATLERPPAGGAMVRADGQQILQAILNLIVNAEQSLAGVANATIAVVVGSSAGQVAVVVGDNAARAGTPGDPFAATSAAGLGLMASRLIARESGGELERLDDARFRLRLPSAPPAL